MYLSQNNHNMLLAFFNEVINSKIRYYAWWMSLNSFLFIIFISEKVEKKEEIYFVAKINFWVVYLKLILTNICSFPIKLVHSEISTAANKQYNRCNNLIFYSIISEQIIIR